MKSYARQLILDFVSRDLSAVRPRSLVLPDEPRRIITVTGARRAGKTHLLLHHIHRLRKTVHPSRLIYINFENDRLFPFTLEKAQQIIETYYEVYPENKSEKVYFFFDEIQNIPEWHLFIRRLYDTENCYLFLTGSSSRMLSREIATSLRGRTITYELFPLSFPEFAGWSGLTTAPGYTSKQRAELVHAFHRYMNLSALPELFGEQDLNVQQSVLHEYINMIIFRDLIERHGLTQHALIKLFIRFLTLNISNPVSINKQFNDYKSQGLQLSKNTLYELLSYLEESYIFYTAGVLTENIREQQRNPKKVYIVDPALKNLMDYRADQGRILENLVYLKLRQNYRDIRYVKRKQEVDFVYEEEGRPRLVNVTYNLSEPATVKREVGGLEEAMKRLAVSESVLVVGEGEGDDIYVDQLLIKIIPAWQWLSVD